MTKPAKNYRDLKVYDLAFEAAMRLFELTKSWPKEERYALIDQVRRSSRSVCANLAEAWRKRRYPAHFVSKLSDADAEAAETEVWVDVAHRCGYIDAEIHAALRDTYDHICRMLTKMMQRPKVWTQSRPE